MGLFVSLTVGLIRSLTVSLNLSHCGFGKSETNFVSNFGSDCMSDF